GSSDPPRGSRGSRGSRSIPRGRRARRCLRPPPRATWDGGACDRTALPAARASEGGGGRVAGPARGPGRPPPRRPGTPPACLGTSGRTGRARRGDDPPRRRPPRRGSAARSRRGAPRSIRGCRPPSVLPVERPAELPHRGEGASLHGSDGDAQLKGDLCLGGTSEVGHLQYLPLVRGEGGEGSTHLEPPLAQVGLLDDTLRYIFAID